MLSPKLPGVRFKNSQCLQLYEKNQRRDILSRKEKPLKTNWDSQERFKYYLADTVTFAGSANSISLLNPCFIAFPASLVADLP